MRVGPASWCRTAVVTVFAVTGSQICAAQEILVADSLGALGCLDSSANPWPAPQEPWPAVVLRHRADSAVQGVLVVDDTRDAEARLEELKRERVALEQAATPWEAALSEARAGFHATLALACNFLASACGSIGPDLHAAVSGGREAAISQERDEDEPTTFLARVSAPVVQFLEFVNQPALPCDLCVLDPEGCWVVALEVLSVKSGGALHVGDFARFLVHSPARDLTLDIHEAPGRVLWLQYTVRQGPGGLSHRLTWGGPQAEDGILGSALVVAEKPPVAVGNVEGLAEVARLLSRAGHLEPAHQLMAIPQILMPRGRAHPHRSCRASAPGWTARP